MHPSHVQEPLKFPGKTVALNCVTGFPDSQQSTGSYIICLGIYRKVGKTGKMHMNSNLSVHTS